MELRVSPHQIVVTEIQFRFRDNLGHMKILVAIMRLALRSIVGAETPSSPQLGAVHHRAGFSGYPASMAG